LSNTETSVPDPKVLFTDQDPEMKKNQCPSSESRGGIPEQPLDRKA